MPLGPSPRPSIEEAPKLERKALISHLKYAFIGDDDTLPIILSIGLLYVQVNEVLAMLKSIKRVI